MPDMSLDLGVIGNAAAAALIDRDARLVWMCAPRMDGDPVFCRLLGGEDVATADESGDWTFAVEKHAQSRQSYVRNTAILETILEDEDGNALRVTDFAPRFKSAGRMFRPLTIVRIVEPVTGTPRMSVHIRPRWDYGTNQPETTRGSNHIRFILGDQVLRLTTNAPVEFVQRGTPFLVDRPYAFVFGPDERLSSHPLDTARVLFQETRDYWIDWARGLHLPADWQDVVIRSAITLKLCSHEETGGIVAALTTSIPEYGATGRTWDYRFCWLRDSFFTVKALNALGADRKSVV